MIGKTHNNGAHSIKKTRIFMMMIFFFSLFLIFAFFQFCFSLQSMKSFLFTHFFNMFLIKTNNIIMFLCKCVCRSVSFFFVNPCCSKENRTCKFFIFWKKACHARWWSLVLFFSRRVVIQVQFRDKMIVKGERDFYKESSSFSYKYVFPFFLTHAWAKYIFIAIFFLPLPFRKKKKSH